MGASSNLRLTRMGLATLGVADAAGGAIIVIIVVIVRAGGGAGLLGVGVSWDVGRVVGVALDLVCHDGRYAGVAVMACVAAGLNKVFRGVA